MHFSGDFGAIKLANDDIDEASKSMDGRTLSAENYASALEDAKNAQEKAEETPTSFSTLFDGSDFGDRISYLSQQFQNGKISAHDYFQSIRDELANTDFSEFTNQAAAAQQFFTDSTQQVASSMSNLINSYNKGEISATEYLDRYTSMAETLSALTDDLQNNSAAWNENGEAISDGTNQALDNAQSDLQSFSNHIYRKSAYDISEGSTTCPTCSYACCAILPASLASLFVAKPDLVFLLRLPSTDAISNAYSYTVLPDLSVLGFMNNSPILLSFQ